VTWLVEMATNESADGIDGLIRAKVDTRHGNVGLRVPLVGATMTLIAATDNAASQSETGILGAANTQRQKPRMQTHCMTTPSYQGLGTTTNNRTNSYSFWSNVGLAS
jgi:hypothetical protein